AADGALEIRDQRAHRRGHLRGLRFRDDVALAEREVAGGDAVDEFDHALAAGEDAVEPKLEGDDAEDGRAEAREHDSPPEPEGSQFGEEQKKKAEENDAGHKEDPHLLSPSEVSKVHRLGRCYHAP